MCNELPLMLPGVVCLEEEQELKASATLPGDGGEKFPLHELLLLASFFPH